MRDAFFKALYELSKADTRIMLLLGDVGAIVLDQYRKDFPDRCLNAGIAEKNMFGVAAGLSLSGKIVYVFTHAIFATISATEQIKLDICLHNLPVKIIGCGPGLDYSMLGPSHHATEDIALMRALPHMTILSPCDELSAASFAELSLKIKGPVYVRLDRTGKPAVYANSIKKHNFDRGFDLVREGQATCYVATGAMVVRALEIADQSNAAVIDLYRIKPFPEDLCHVLDQYKKIVTFEEHNIIGGIGSAVAESLAEHRLGFSRTGVPDKFVYDCGPRRFVQDVGLKWQV